jgi:predicted nicotinamide N-methyase
MESFEGVPLIEEDIRIGDRSYRIARVANVDQLFSRLLEKPDDHPDVTDERIPYWAEVWPSAIGLATFLLQYPEQVAGRQVLEIGCGLGLPGIVAGSLGARVLLSDYLAEALTLAGHNWRLNQYSDATTRQLDWRDLSSMPEADLVIASDVAYESRAFPDLEKLIRHYLSRRSTILLSEPQRQFASTFFHSLNTLAAHSMFSLPITRNGITTDVRVHTLRPSAT